LEADEKLKSFLLCVMIL